MNQPSAGTIKNLLVVGGTGRNVGKTEFVCRLIEKCIRERRHRVHALKVSAVFPEELQFHGSHDDNEPPFQLFEETDPTSDKDTGRMLRAGAERVFYLRCSDADILSAFISFCRAIPADATIVCESNSLAEQVHPALLVMVKSMTGSIKPRSHRQLQDADLVVVSDGRSGFPELANITIDESGAWRSSSR